MLKASYREVTGRSMPTYMSADDALAELRRSLPLICGSKDDAQTTLKVILAAAKLKKRLVVAQKRRKDEAIHSAAQAAGWDEDAYAMLAASYREVTGRAIPPHMSPDVAAAELRRALPILIDFDPTKMLPVVVAAMKLKKLLQRRQANGRRLHENAEPAAADAAGPPAWPPELGDLSASDRSTVPDYAEVGVCRSKC